MCQMTATDRICAPKVVNSRARKYRTNDRCRKAANLPGPECPDAGSALVSVMRPGKGGMGRAEVSRHGVGSVMALRRAVWQGAGGNFAKTGGSTVRAGCSARRLSIL